MMKRASGKDVILQKNEFSRWSRRHTAAVSKWAAKAGAEGKTRAVAEGNMEGSRFTAKGQAQARNVIGFRKFLKDFTLLEERGSAEVALWHDYNTTWQVIRLSRIMADSITNARAMQASGKSVSRGGFGGGGR